MLVLEGKNIEISLVNLVKKAHVRYQVSS